MATNRPTADTRDAAQTYLDALTPDAHQTLFEILTSSPAARADAIGRLHVRDDGGDLAELLIRA